MEVIACKGAGLSLLLFLRHGPMPGVSGQDVQALGLLRAKFSRDGKRPYAGLPLFIPSHAFASASQNSLEF